MNKTYTPSHNKIERDWHLVDAKGKVLGKLASDVAVKLIGKDKATFTPNINVGAKVVVINAKEIEVTGNKELDKKYYSYSNYPGGIKMKTYQQLKEQDSTKIIRLAVSGMLPKNKLRKERLANLYIYEDEKHPHQGQIKV